jgi:hypothetical protein
MYARSSGPDKNADQAVDNSGSPGSGAEQDRSVRWDALFDDLTAQAGALDEAELAAEVAERTRGEVAGLGLHDRLRAARDSPLQLTLRGGWSLRGALLRTGSDWLLLSEPDRREALVATGQLLGVRGLHRAAAVPGAEGIVEARIGIGQPLRALCRDRSPVQMHLIDGSERHVVIDRVGADFVDVSHPTAPRPSLRVEHPAGELLAIAAIAAVRRSV